MAIGHQGRLPGPGANRMPPAARRGLIVEILDREGSVTTGRLAEETNVSVVTIHRDLELMEAEGSLVRIRGGATVPSGRGAQVRFVTNWEARLAAHADAKRAIAREAHRLIEPSSTIFIDGSTTALALAVALDADPVPVTVVTDSPAAVVAMHAPEVQIVMVPGHVDHDLRMLSGRWTTDFIRELNYTAAFVSCAAVDLKAGATTTRREILDVLQTVMERSQATYCLADSSKFGRAAMLGIAAVTDFDAVLTDDRLDASVAAAYRASGVRLVECRLRP